MLYTSDARETAIDLYYARLGEIEVTTALTDVRSGETLYAVRDLLKPTGKIGARFHVWERASTPDFDCDCDFSDKPCQHVGAALIYRAAQAALADQRASRAGMAV